MDVTVIPCEWCGKDLKSTHIVRKPQEQNTYFVCANCRNTLIEKGYKQIAWWESITNKGNFLDIQPSMSNEEINFVSNILVNINPKHVLEYGSGGSTVFFPKFTPNIEAWIAVEHNHWWEAEVSKAVNKKYPEKFIHVACVPSTTGRWDERTDTLEEDEIIFKRYVDYPSKREPFCYDIIIVDGVARIGCLTNVWKVSKKGTLVILHDSEREWYEPGVKALIKSGAELVATFESFWNGNNKQIKIFKFTKEV